MSVEESVHVIFDETNFSRSGQENNHVKIGLAHLEDDDEETKMLDEGTAGEQLIPEEAERNNDNQEQTVFQEQQTVSNPAVPTDDQANPEAEQNNNQANETEHASVPT